MTATSVTSQLIDGVRFLDTETSHGSLTSTNCESVVASDDRNGTAHCRSSQICHNKFGRYLIPRTKPTIVVMVWILLFDISYALIYTVILHETQESLISSTIFLGANVIEFLSILMAGFLADSYWGRFRLITFGLLIWWLLLVAAWIGLILVSTVGTHNLFPLLFYMVPACVLALVAVFVGLPAFVANIIQFGVDQLPYAASDEVNIYIHWIVWVFMLGNVVGVAIGPLSVNWEPAIQLTLMGLLVVIFGATILMSIYCRHWFHTEYIKNNLYSLIWRVLNFARKHRTPVCRSALTYCENDPPSRIDLGKTKYGGPFTTEQVEDVKTFLRVLGLIILASGTFTPLYCIISLSRSYSIPVCTEFTYISNLVTIVSEILVIPINILVIYPMCRNYYPGALKRMGLAIVLMLSAVLIDFIITLISIDEFRFQSEELVNNCSTSFQNTSQGIAHFIPGFLSGISNAFFTPALFGFICAQSPQKMLGILIGVAYVIEGLFMLIGETFAVPALILRSNLSHYSYDWVTYLVCFVFGVGGLFLYTAVARLYKFRERDEEPKDQLYVEAYYNKIIQ